MMMMMIRISGMRKYKGLVAYSRVDTRIRANLLSNPLNSVIKVARARLLAAGANLNLRNPFSTLLMVRDLLCHMNNGTYGLRTR